MGAVNVKADSVAAPRAAADATGKLGVYRIASATSNTSTSLGTTHAFCGNYVRILSRTVDTQVAFTVGAAQTLVINQASALGTGHAAAGFTILAGTYIDVIVPRGLGQAVWFNFISSATGGYVELYMSEALVV